MKKLFTHTRPITNLMVHLAFCLQMSVSSAPAMDAPSGLLCNLLTQPEKCVITEPQPDFGWIVNSSQAADVQSAYQILVASSAALLEKENGDLWNSGKIASPQSINVLYGGNPLVANSSYWWCVRTWNKDGKPSALSNPQRFNTGEFNRANKKWPGESRWVQLADEAGNKNSTFEDRPPVNFHARSPGQVHRNEDGSWFIDFEKAAFSTLELTIHWEPRDASKLEHVVQVALGEKNLGTTVDPKPGGGIIYRCIPLKVVAGKHRYQLEIPRHRAHYPHSQVMPAIMPEVLPFRYCQIMPEGELIVVGDAVQQRLWVEFDDAAAAFTSSNENLNAVYELCKYSVKVNTFNGDYAASQRERMMYEADSYIHQMSHYATDRNFATARYSVENQIFKASWPTEWILHSIFMAWADYLHTGNPRSIARFYDQLKPKTLMALRDEHNLISTRTGKADDAFRKSIHLNRPKQHPSDIVDWPSGERDRYDFRTYNTVVNAFHYRSLVLMSRIADALGKDEDAIFYREEADKVRAAVNALMWDKERNLYRDGIGSNHHSYHANLFPLAFDMVPDDRRRAVLDYLVARGGEMPVGVYPTVYLLEALFDAGEAQAAIDMMTATHDRSWMHMIRLGSTVTTEAWDVKYKGNSGWTHAWSSAPAQILPRKLIGIEPLEPGFGKVRIQPRPGNLTCASARLPTIRGFIDAGFERDAADSFTLNVTLPANMVAEVALPDLGHPSDELSVNGRKVKGRRAAGRVWLTNLGSGTYRIVRHAK